MAKTYTATCSCGEKTPTPLAEWNAGFPCPKCGETVKRQSKAGTKLGRAPSKLARKRPVGGSSIVARKSSLKPRAKKRPASAPATSAGPPPLPKAPDADKPSTAKIVKKTVSTETMAAVPIPGSKPAVAPVVAKPAVAPAVAKPAVPAVPARGPVATVSPIDADAAPAPEVSTPDLPNAPGLPYPVVQGRPVDDDVIPSDELRQRQADLDPFDSNTDTGSMTVRIPSLRPRKVLRPATDSMPSPTPVSSSTTVLPATATTAVPVAAPAMPAVDRAETEELKTKVLGLEEALEEAQESGKNARLQAEQAKEKLATAEAAALVAEDALQEQKVDLKAAEASQNMLKEQIERLQGEVITLSETRTKLQMKVHEGTMKTDAELKSLRHELEKASSKSKVLHAKLQETVKEKVGMQQSLKQLSEKSESGAKDRTKLITEIKRLREQVAHAKQVPELKREAMTANAKLAKVVEQYKAVAAKARNQEEVSKDYLRQKMELEAKMSHLESSSVNPKELAELKRRADDAEMKVDLLTEKLAEAHRTAASAMDDEDVERLRIENRILREKLLQ
ncbi:MAG: putative RNA-binding Zn-ribbon protein involved in translation (DUF1610 family) [Rhodothermales bacterium]|jgi:predicted RNA-binding Zn-ribbon protein involved in translation (DUF1610 family)